MTEKFFTTKEVAKITGCSLRQLQYWREREVIVPVVNATGTGRSIYYAQEQLLEIAIMLYLLSLGLTFQMGMDILIDLRSHQLNLAEDKEPQRLMLCWNGEKFELETFATNKAIAFLEEGKAVIPLWLDKIYQQITDQL
jgi:DNA-binding transcriptional MerR regulator